MLASALIEVVCVPSSIPSRESDIRANVPPSSSRGFASSVRRRGSCNGDIDDRRMGRYASRLSKSTLSASIPQPSSKFHLAKPRRIRYLSHPSASSRHPKSLSRDPKKTPRAPPQAPPWGREKKTDDWENMEILTIVNQLDREFGVVRGRWVVDVVVIGWGNDFGALVGYCCHRERGCVGGLLRAWDC